MCYGASLLFLVEGVVVLFQELIGLLPEGQNKLQECEHWLQQTMDTTAFISRQGLKAELDVVKLEWDDYTIRLHSVCDRLQQVTCPPCCISVMFVF